jgi:hypothetical protein
MTVRPHPRRPMIWPKETKYTNQARRRQIGLEILQGLRWIKCRKQLEAGLAKVSDALPRPVGQIAQRHHLAAAGKSNHSRRTPTQTKERVQERRQSWKRPPPGMYTNAVSWSDDFDWTWELVETNTKTRENMSDKDEPNYTHGPWLLNEEKAGDHAGTFAIVRKLGPGANPIAVVYPPWLGGDDENESTAANARLIAAAPDLLEACFSVLRDIAEQKLTAPELERKIHNAVERALGKRE